MSEALSVGLVQMRSGRSAAENLKAASEMIREAKGAGAQFVLTPENTTLMETERKRLDAQTLPDAGEHPAVSHFSALAEELGISLLIGSMAIKLGDGKWANRSFLFGPDGRLVGRYDKIHMFDVVVSEAEQYRESASYRAGTSPVVAGLPFGKVGLTICYDLRFPYLYRALAAAGARILTVPSAFTKVTGTAHWQVLLRARAIETGCFVLAPAQGGSHENGRETYGHSLVVGPWGEVLAEAGEDPCILVSKLDLSLVDAARRRIPALEHTAPLGPVVTTI